VVNTTSTPQTATVTNTSSTTALAITSIGIALTAGGANTDYAITGNTCPISPQTLAASATCQILVSFTPSQIAVEPATSLTVTATGVGTLVTVLTGTGTKAGTGGGGGGGTADFTMTTSSTGVSVPQGSTATYTFLITPQNGSKDTVSFTCNGPSGSTCSTTPTTVAMDGSNSQVVTLLVGTTGGSGAGAKSVRPQLIPRSIFFALLPFSIVGILLINKRRGYMLALMLVVICLLLGMSACGGSNSSGSSNGLAPGSYQIAFVATSNAATPTTVTYSLTLVVSSQ